MVISDLIAQLEPLAALEKPIFASIPALSVELGFIQTLLGNGIDFPALGVYKEEPLPYSWDCHTVLKGLFRWLEEVNESSANILLKAIYEYPDGSYEFRYFNVLEIRDTDNKIILVGDQEEYVDMREYFEALDESLFEE